MDAVVGIDIGTSGLKALAAEPGTGKTLKRIRLDYPEEKIGNQAGIVPVSVYEEAVSETLQMIGNEFSVCAVGLSTQMYSICRKTEDRTEVIQWNAPWKENKAADILLKNQYERSGCPSDTIFPAFKYLSSENKKTFLPYGLKEHLMQYLTGKLTVDYSTASASGFFEVNQRTWNKDIICRTEFDLSAFPEPLEPGTIAGTLKLKGFEGIPVTPAPGDGPSASLACSGISSLCGNIGTSGAVRVISDKKLRNADKGLWTFAMNDIENIIGGISSNCCSVINWADGLQMIEKEKPLIKSSSGKFFPWLRGERTPYWSTKLRAGFSGIDSTSDRDTISTAIFKGVGFSLCRMVNMVLPLAEGAETVVLAGGGLHWKPLLEVLTGAMPISMSVLDDGDYLAARGAAISAAKAIGEQMEGSPPVESRIEPDGSLRKEYEEWIVAADERAAYEKSQD